MREIQKYIHKVQYYETDQMRVVHHSNYIRWFEEARVDLMEQMGMGYDRMEELGIASPVLGVEADYLGHRVHPNQDEGVQRHQADPGV